MRSVTRVQMSVRAVVLISVSSFVGLWGHAPLVRARGPSPLAKPGVAKSRAIRPRGITGLHKRNAEGRGNGAGRRSFTLARAREDPLVSYQLTRDIFGEEFEPTTRSYGIIDVASTA